MMKLLFLGSGSAFTVGGDNYHSNMLLMTENDDKLLIDCGSDIRFSLFEEGFSHRDITDIYISHLHSDHVGGLEYIGLSSKFDPQCNKPNLYLSKDVASEIWENTLSGGMRSVSGDLMTLDDYFSVHPIAFGCSFRWQKIEFKVIRVLHIDNGYYLMPSYGLFFTINHCNILLTTDTQLCLDYLKDYYEKADIIFNDCEIAPFPTSVHAHYKALTQLPISIKQKMWLYGYQAEKLPDAKADNFEGFVQRGQCFEF